MLEVLKKIFESIEEMLCLNFKRTVLNFKNRQLIRCVKKGKISWIEYLLDKDADINCKDESGRTLAQIVIDDLEQKPQESEEELLDRKRFMLNFLADKGIDIDFDGYRSKTMLQYACKRGKLEFAKGIISLGANINAKNSNGETALIEACKYGWYDMAKLLLSFGANANIPNTSGEYPLHIATVNDDFELINLLLDNGADINLSDNYKNTPLHYACRLGNSSIVSALIDNGANLNSVNILGNTPLHDVCINGAYNIFPLLILNNANIECLNNCNWAPIHYVCENNHIEMLDFLLSMNVNVNLKTSEGYTPLRIAVENGNNEVVKKLLDCNVNINARYTSGWQVIHYAVKKNYMNTVMLLEKYGAQLDSKTFDNFTPYKIAESEHNYDMLDFLESRLLSKKYIGTSLILQNINKFTYNICKYFTSFSSEINNKRIPLIQTKNITKLLTFEKSVL